MSAAAYTGQNDAPPSDHPSGLPNHRDEQIVIEASEIDVLDHTEALSELNPVDGHGAQETAAHLSKAFRLAQAALGTLNGTSSFSLELSIQEAAILAVAHSLRAHTHRAAQRENTAETYEEHSLELFSAVTKADPQPFLPQTHVGN